MNTLTKKQQDLEKEYSNYQERRVEDCLNILKRIMRDVSLSKNNEFRIAKNKIGEFRIPLLTLYQDAFAQGVYTAK